MKSMKAVLMFTFCSILIAGLVACDGRNTTTTPNTEGNSTVTAQSTLPVGDPNCPTGGVQLDYGIDENGNGVLDPTEVDGSEYICNGENGLDGSDGLTALINTTALSAGDANCPAGGYRVDSGLDENANSVLDPDEVSSTSYLCNEVYTPLVVNTVSSTQIDLDWSAMAGDPSVAYYDVYMNHLVIHSTADASTTSQSVTGLMQGTVYCFMVTGLDSLYNVVVQSPEVCAVTSGSHSDTWTAITTSNAPTARFGHTAVWTGTSMLVWGGMNFSIPAYFNDGRIYDPATDTWTAMNTAGAPSKRYVHTAVWTGTKMIVWGGYGGLLPSPVLNTGGIYDPATDTWTAMSTINAPSARYLFSAVWTGTKMIVWGGSDDTNYLNTGGIYDPATDTWTTMNTASAPSARESHKAVWTGTKMLVWGGRDSVFLNTGGIYDPATDTWTTMSTTDAPSARSLHAAVWTGTKMVVWGGYDFTYLDTGGIYDSATDTWTTMSTTNAPSARGCEAVWTGTKMIIWGWFDGSYLNTGGIYDPATDSWTTMSTINAPSARYAHTTVWTGTRVIVWGGRDEPFFDTGGIYTP